MRSIIFIITYLLLNSSLNAAELSSDLMIALKKGSSTDPEIVWGKLGRPCNYELLGDSYSYLSMLVDAAFESSPFNEELDLDVNRISSFVVFLHKNGCDINSPHPLTGHLPIHSAVIFYRKNIQLAKYIVVSGGNLKAKVPGSDKNFPEMNAVEILKSVISKCPPQPEREELLHEIETNPHL